MPAQTSLSGHLEQLPGAPNIPMQKYILFEIIV